MTIETESTIDDTFADRLRAARLEGGLTQAEVAAALTASHYDFHQTTVAKIERATRRVTIGEALALASAVGKPLDDLLSVSDEPSSLVGLTLRGSALEEDMSRWVESAEMLVERQQRLQKLVDDAAPEVRDEINARFALVLNFEFALASARRWHKAE